MKKLFITIFTSLFISKCSWKENQFFRGNFRKRKSFWKNSSCQFLWGLVWHLQQAN